MGVLSDGSLTYSELMKEVGIEDSGKLSYHLGVLSRYINHEKDLYSLSIEGRVLHGAVEEFEKRSYGLMGNMTGSGIVDYEGYLKIAYSVKFSLMTPGGDLLQRKTEEKFDKAKADAAIRSRMDELDLGVFSGVSMDSCPDGLTLSLEHEVQAFEEKDGWMVEKSGLDIATPRFEGEERAPPMPGLHLRFRGSVLYPESAIIEREYPERKALEEKGVEVYEFTTTNQNLRWRVKKEDVICLGESRLEMEGNTTRRIVDMEIHGILRDPSKMVELREQMKNLPILVSGKLRFRQPDPSSN